MTPFHTASPYSQRSTISASTVATTDSPISPGSHDVRQTERRVDSLTFIRISLQEPCRRQARLHNKCLGQQEREDAGTSRGWSPILFPRLRLKDCPIESGDAAERLSLTGAVAVGAGVHRRRRARAEADERMCNDTDRTATTHGQPAKRESLRPETAVETLGRGDTDE